MENNNMVGFLYSSSQQAECHEQQNGKTLLKIPAWLNTKKNLINMASMEFGFDVRVVCITTY